MQPKIASVIEEKEKKLKELKNVEESTHNEMLWHS